MTRRLIVATLVAVAIAVAEPRAETHHVMPTAFLDTYSAAHAPVSSCAA